MASKTVVENEMANPEVEYCDACDSDHQYATDCPEHPDHDPSPQEQWEVTRIGGWG